MGARLGPRFFERPCVEVAPELVGAYLVHRLADGTRLAGRIVEVEAYVGDGSDPASHSHGGPTPRNRVMFGPPGRLYVYRSYGIHTCANVVCEREGSSAAVLLRALEPVEGIDRMRRYRKLPANRPDRELTNGPGKLCQALGITLDHYGEHLARGAIELRAPAAADPTVNPAVSARIGITKAVVLPYRFFDPGSDAVSRGRPAALCAQRRSG